MAEIHEILPGYRAIISRIEALAAVIATHRKHKQVKIPSAIIVALAGREMEQDAFRTDTTSINQILKKNNKPTPLMITHYEKRKLFFDNILSAAEEKITSLPSKEVREIIREREGRITKATGRREEEVVSSTRDYYAELKNLTRSYSHILSLPPAVSIRIKSERLPAPEKTLATVVTELRQHRIEI